MTTSNSSLLFFIIPLLLLQIPTLMHAKNEHFESCGNLISCGTIQNISYPFYGENRPENCGYPGFNLSCESETLYINIGQLKYRVVGINGTQAILTIAREDLSDNLCPTYLYDTWVDSDVFSYGPSNTNVTLGYGCSSDIPNKFECEINGTTSVGVYSISGLNNVTCNTSINVPISSGSGENVLGNLTRAITGDELRRAIGSGFEVQWLTFNKICKQCSESGGRCGYELGSSSFVCYCDKGTFPVTCNVTTTENGSEGRLEAAIIAIIAISVSVGAFLILSVIAFYCRRGRSLSQLCNWKSNGNDRHVETFIRNWGSLGPKQYNYSEIKKITNNFNEKLGQGGFGSVFKGKLSDGRLVAVKVLDEAHGNGDDFINEVSSISKTSHFNVVTLLGFCYYKKRALVYEFLSNGSLDKYINIYKNGSADHHDLAWKTLYNIIVGTARGLEYLHVDCNPKIIHFDIKPQNILLDEDFCPKIADFGLAKLAERKMSILSMHNARGTAGYIAPEVFFRRLGGVSHKSDVYSFGMMVLEMVGVRHYTTVTEDKSSLEYFPNWIYEYLEFGKDIGIQVVKDEEEEEIVRKLMLVGLWCIQTNQIDRPPMSEVVGMLVGSLDSLRIPPHPKQLKSPVESEDSCSRLTKASYNGDFQELV